MTKPILALHDLSCFGRSALQVIIPTLASFGLMTCPVPTAILSTHTGGFNDYTFVNLSDHMIAQLEHWKKLNLSFSAIYPGFLGSEEQVDIVKAYSKTFKKADTFLLVDPVLGDDGQKYSSITEPLVKAMRQLVFGADLITPNMTEANLLLELPLEYVPKKENCPMYLKKLATLGAKNVIITSIPNTDTRLSLLYYEKEKNNALTLTFPKIERSYPGTGDIFCSLLLGYQKEGASLFDSTIKATRFLSFAMQQTVLAKTPIREGLLLEESLLKRKESEHLPFDFQVEKIFLP